MIIGAHASAAGGIIRALDRAHNIGAEAVQLFITSPRSYRITEYSDEQIEEFNRVYKEKNFKGLFFHCIYLLNLAAPSDSLYQLSIKSLIYYLQIGDKLGAVGTIVHLGSWGVASSNVADSAIPAFSQSSLKTPVGSPSAGMSPTTFGNFNRLIAAIKIILEMTPKSQYFIIENTAAGGGRIGANLVELEAIYKAVNDSRVKFCIDTQHLYASGVDTSNFQVFSNWLSEFDRRIGIDNIICLHANDSKTELGSKHDRHENIGDGKIGLDGFKNILSQPLLQ
ncbi:MAG TPA: deoxyribonuclease IV, partial [Candidatus Nitrosocosmicus sp.]|nr:deoxyribonuclease IV [Candidatus Nitrosocosmicus sp.]